MNNESNDMEVTPTTSGTPSGTPSGSGSGRRRGVAIGLAGGLLAGTAAGLVFGVPGGIDASPEALDAMLRPLPPEAFAQAGVQNARLVFDRLGPPPDRVRVVGVRADVGEPRPDGDVVVRGAHQVALVAQPHPHQRHKVIVRTATIT